MPTFTVFCRHNHNLGTTWIESLQAESASAAAQLGAVECATDWDCEPSEIWVLGVAEGDVKILIWEDME